MVIVILYTHGCFNRTVLESTKLFTGCPHLLKFLLVMKEIIKDSYETAFQLLWRWFIFFVFCFVFCFVFLYLAPIMVWRVGLSTLFMFPFLYLGFNNTFSFQKLILKTSSTSSCLTESTFRCDLLFHTWYYDSFQDYKKRNLE